MVNVKAKNGLLALMGEALHKQTITHLDQMWWKLGKVRYVGNVLAVFVELFQAGFETIQGGNAKIEHFAVVRFSEGIEHVPKGHSKFTIVTENIKNITVNNIKSNIL